MSLTSALRCEDPNRTGSPDDFDEINDSIPEFSDLLEILDDDVIFNEAFSIDAIQAPYPYANGNFQRCANSMAVGYFKTDVIDAIAQQDFDALGRLVSKLATDYAERIYDIRHN